MEPSCTEETKNYTEGPDQTVYVHVPDLAALITMDGHQCDKQHKRKSSHSLSSFGGAPSTRGLEGGLEVSEGLLLGTTSAEGGGFLHSRTRSLDNSSQEVPCEDALKDCQGQENPAKICPRPDAQHPPTGSLNDLIEPFDTLDLQEVIAEQTSADWSPTCSPKGLQ